MNSGWRSWPRWPAVVGFVLLATVMFATAHQRHVLYAGAERQAMVQIQAEADLAAAFIAQHSEPNTLGALKLIEHRRLTIINADGTVRFDSEADVSRMDNHNSRPEVLAARTTGGSGTARRRSDTINVDSIYGARLMPDGTVVRVSAPLTLGPVGRDAGPIITATTVSLLLVAAVLIVKSLRDWRVARELRAVCDDFALGQFSRRAHTASRGALGALGHALNDLGARFERTLDDAARQRSLLDSALGALREGVVCIDPLDRVVYANPAFKQLAASGGEVLGQLFYEHLPASVFANSLAAARADRAAGTTGLVEFDHGRKRLQGVLVPAGADVVVLVLHDVTEVRRVERTRRDFMAAVSHEFKTPLTTIAGFAETLLDGALEEDPEQSRLFVGKIARQAERLASLVNDVLTLSRAEQGAWQVRAAPADLVTVARTVIDDYQPASELKGVSLHLDAPETLPVHSDAELLRQVLGNLVSNAIRYNRIDGQVRMGLRLDGPMAVVTVSDTGIGIANEHHDRIFERFYRVDAHRSRQTGGTGLGLSIVKELVSVLGGTITLSSSGSGTVFTVAIPLRADGVVSAMAETAARH